MLATIKKKFTAAWKAHAAAIGAGLMAYVLGLLGLAPEPDPAVVGSAISGLGELVFAVISGGAAWLATYFGPANTTE